jgi:hypothetical protein
MLGVELANRESLNSWKEVFEGLRNRGLRGTELVMNGERRVRDRRCSDRTVSIHKKVKAAWITPNGLHRSGSVLLSHSLICSTIAAERLNFRVRNGNGWIPLAIATEKVVGLGYLRGYR